MPTVPGGQSMSSASPLVRMVRLVVLATLLLLAVLCVWLAAQPTQTADKGLSRRAEKRAAERRHSRWQAVFSCCRSRKRQPAEQAESKRQVTGHSVNAVPDLLDAAESDGQASATLTDNDADPLSRLAKSTGNEGERAPPQHATQRNGFSTPPRAPKHSARASRRPQGKRGEPATPLPAVTPQRGQTDDLWDSPLMRHENVDTSNAAQGLLLEYIAPGDALLQHRPQQVSGGHPELHAPGKDRGSQVQPMARSEAANAAQEPVPGKRTRRRRRHKANPAESSLHIVARADNMRPAALQHADPAILAVGQACVPDLEFAGIGTRGNGSGRGGGGNRALQRAQQPSPAPAPAANAVGANAVGANAVGANAAEQVRKRREKAKWGDMDQPTPMFKAKAPPPFFGGGGSISLDTTLDVSWSEIQLESPQQGGAAKVSQPTQGMDTAFAGPGAKADAASDGVGNDVGAQHELYTREKRLRKRRKQKKFYPAGGT